MTAPAHRWSLGKAWLLSEEQAPVVADGAEPAEGELVFRGVTCIDCYVDYARADSPCRRRSPIARNTPCPCGSGRKYKDCGSRGRCGAGR
jgi:uncharacterized protein YecA (UPF0149 family)